MVATIVDTSPFGRVVSIVVSTGVAEAVGMFDDVAREVDDTPPPTLAGTGVVIAEADLVGSALGSAEAPMGRVVVETTPLEVTGHTNWKVVITRVFRDMEAASPCTTGWSSPGGQHQQCVLRGEERAYGPA